MLDHLLNTIYAEKCGRRARWAISLAVVQIEDETVSHQVAVLYEEAAECETRWGGSFVIALVQGLHSCGLITATEAARFYA